MNRIARYPECKYCINCDSDNAHRCNCPLCRFHARQVAVLLTEYAEGMAVYMPGIGRMA